MVEVDLQMMEYLPEVAAGLVDQGRMEYTWEEVVEGEVVMLVVVKIEKNSPEVSLLVWNFSSLTD